jgi:hypothetical protein
VPFAAEPVGLQFRPEELFDLLGALGFARCRCKSRVANRGPRFGRDENPGAEIDRRPGKIGLTGAPCSSRMT